MSHTGWLGQKFIFSQFRSPGVWDPGTSVVGFWWRLSSWLADGHLLNVSLRGGGRATKSLVPLFVRTLTPSWGLSLMTSSNPHYLPEAHLQTPSHWWTCGGMEGIQIFVHVQDPDLEVQLKGLQVIWWTESMTLSSHPLETPVSDIKGQ